ncbi:uncharacterized protein LOC101759697 [Setaria italica]|uniref:uncharacterized protein LOC101759697 n=1 Tax=Setaria italica TaxID=4555 RepID=UPI000350983C|nr:uncharacterized protein LOC101759697 [Setaria italica]
MDQGIPYVSGTAIKSQVFTDFIAEWIEVQTPSTLVEQKYWTMYFDGSLMKTGAGAGLVCISLLGVSLRFSSMGSASASSWASDGLTSKLEDKFDCLELNHIARCFNEAADELAKAASGRRPVYVGVFVSNLHKPLVRYEELGEAGNKPPVPDLEADPSDPEVMEIDADPAERADPLPDWRAPYLDYLIRKSLPTDKTEAQRIVRHAKSFVIINQELYKQSHTRILQRCIPFEQGRPFKKAPGSFTHLLIAVDKFTKWIEARPIAQIKSEQVVKFFTNITHCFGIPNSIIMDNGTQFTGKKFLSFCDDHHIRVDWSAMAHPCTNGQVEQANGRILQGLKPWIFNRLNKFGG